MKTITIDDKKIEISDESYEAFKKQFVTKDKAILWKPEKTYWYIEDAGEIFTDEGGCFGFEHRYELGNVFRTEEEAEEALKTGWIAKRKAEVEILRFIAENDLEFEPDWEDSLIKHFIQYSYSDERFKINFFVGNQCNTGSFHFKSEKDAQKVIDAMTPQLKILFGVRG